MIVEAAPSDAAAPRARLGGFRPGSRRGIPFEPYRRERRTLTRVKYSPSLNFTTTFPRYFDRLLFHETRHVYLVDELRRHVERTRLPFR